MIDRRRESIELFANHQFKKSSTIINLMVFVID